MTLKSYIVTVVLVVGVCWSGYAFQPSAAPAFVGIAPSSTPSPRRKPKLRPIQSPSPSMPVSGTRTFKEGGVNDMTNMRTGQSERQNSAFANRTESIGKDTTMIIPEPVTSGSANQLRGQKVSRSGKETRTSQPTSVKEKQDIEVENDETHIVGSGRKSAAPANGSANRRSTPRNTRTETVDNNETITVHRGVNEPGNSGANTRIRKGTVRKGSHTRSVRRHATRKTAGKRVIK